MRLRYPALAVIALAPFAQAQIALNPSQSWWAGTTLVTLSGNSNGTSLYMGNEIGPGFDPSYMGAVTTTQVSPTMFATVLNATTYPAGGLVLQPNLAGTHFASGTMVRLSYTGLTEAPSYAALIGGQVISYTYANGEISILAYTGNLANTPSIGGGFQGLAFIIETSPSFDFGGALFRTDAYWGDLANMVGGYPGDTPLVGLNVNGIAGNAVSFDAYLSTSYLQSIGINSGSEARAVVQKAGTSFEVPVTTTLFTAGGNDPGLDGTAYDVFGGASIFDFDGLNANGGYADDFIMASYSNSSWSTGNIGLSAPIPEPSTYGLAIGGLALAVAALRRRSKISK